MLVAALSLCSGVNIQTGNLPSLATTSTTFTDRAKIGTLDVRAKRTNARARKKAV